MALPAIMTPTPQSTITVSDGYAADASSEFWQRVTGNVFFVYEGVPASLAANILASPDVDTAIKLQLAGYPRRINGV